MKTIWVTGSNGQLGTEIKLRSTGYSEDFNFLYTDIEELDLTNKEKVEGFFYEKKPDFIINCAAYTAVYKAETDAENAFLLNKKVPAYLSGLTQNTNTQLIQISTDYVFDGKSYRPYVEDDLTNPQSVYGKSKLEGEKEVLKNKKNIVIRTSWLYSAHGSNFVKTMLRLGKEKEEVNVIFDQVGSPTSAADLADAILKIVSKIVSSGEPHPGIYHYSNEGVCSWYDFAIEIMGMTHLKCRVIPIESKDYPTPTPRPHYSVLNKRKIKETFGIEIRHWKEGFVNVIEKFY